MKKNNVYSALCMCLLLFSSCLGDTNTRITVGEQEAVYQIRPTKGFAIKDGRLLYGSNVSVNGNEGDCFLIEYSFDSSSPELQGSDSLSVELTSTGQVPLWPLDNQLTDTARVLKNEVLTTSLLKRNAYIKGRLFLWSNHTEAQAQQDSFMISYNPEQLFTTEEGKRIYHLYLRAVKQVTETANAGKQVNVLRLNAFHIEDFFNKAKASEEAKGGSTLYIAINYASAYNKDTTACLWSKTAEPIAFVLDEKAE